MKSLIEELKKRNYLVADGAWGTELFKKGLKSGECPELLNKTNEMVVSEIAESYLTAGSDLIETNSFGGNLFKLKHYGLETYVYDLNFKAAQISRMAAGDDKFVIGSVGPTGKFLMMDDVTEDRLYDAFKDQIIGLRDGGVDALCIETFYDIDEAKCAIKAAKENSDLEICCSFTYNLQKDGSFKTLMGNSPNDVVEKLLELDVDIIGTNCGSGFKDMINLVKDIKTHSKEKPIWFKANAGLPELENGVLSYPESPEIIMNYFPQIIKNGARIIGGCCGTTPDHIKAIKNYIEGLN